MHRTAPLRCSRLPRLLAFGTGVALLLLAVGCSTFSADTYPIESPLAHYNGSPVTTPAKIHHSEHALPHGSIAGPGRDVLITFDAVLRLAEQYNPQLSVAREKLNESLVAQKMTDNCWLPNIYAGVAYYRHEGGIQNEDGRLTHSSTGAISPGVQIQTEFDRRESIFQRVSAERQVWQQRAEITKINNEILLDAATTYVDLLTAQRGEVLARELAEPERRLLNRVEKLAKEEVAIKSLISGLRSSLTARELAASKMRQQMKAASAKLTYLLGLPPNTTLRPGDEILAPFELVDVTPSTGDLCQRALATGPGVQELEGLLHAIESGIEATELARYLPSVCLNIYEGPFLAGRGGGLSTDNRFDFTVQVRWNLSSFQRAPYQRSLAHSKKEQVELTLHDLRAKLVAGVQEARDTVLETRQQIGLASTQLKFANESYNKVNKRFEDGVEGTTPGDVLLTIRALDQGYVAHLAAINAHNKAQIRLLLLTGCQPTTPRVAPVVLPETPKHTRPSLRQPREEPPPPAAEDDELGPPRQLDPPARKTSGPLRILRSEDD